MTQDKQHLHLVLTDHWYEMIESGQKDEEYRDLTNYWWNRIFTSRYPDLQTLSVGSYNGKFKYVRFQKAYRKNPLTIIWKMGHQGIGNANS